jgi:ferritin-like metal-binding protein YciE
MEKEVNEYIEGQPKKKKTREETTAWLNELANRVEKNLKETKEAIKNLEDMFPEVFK